MKMPHLSRRMVLGGFASLTLASFLEEILRQGRGKQLEPPSPNPDAYLRRWEPVRVSESLKVQVVGCRHTPQTFLDGANTIDGAISSADVVILEGPATEYTEMQGYARLAKPKEGVLDRLREKIGKEHENNRPAFFSAIAALTIASGKSSYIAEIETTELSRIFSEISEAYAIGRSLLWPKMHIAESPILLEGFSMLKKRIEVMAQERMLNNRELSSSRFVELAYDLRDRRDAYLAWTLHLLSDQLTIEGRALNVALFRGAAHPRALTHYLKPENREECRLKALSYPFADVALGTKWGEPIQMKRITEEGTFVNQSLKDVGK